MFITTVQYGGAKMLCNLHAEMARNGVTVKNLEMLLGKSNRTIRDKINGKAAFTLPEAQKIKHQLFPSLSLDYLFSEEM